MLEKVTFDFEIFKDGDARLDIFSLIMQNYFILDYLVDEERPQSIEYTASGLFNILNIEECKHQYIVPRMNFIGEKLNFFKINNDITIEQVYRDVCLENAIALHNTRMKVIEYKNNFYQKGYNRFKDENVNEILRLHKTFFPFINSINREKILDGDQTVIDKLYDIRESLYNCLYSNEVIAIHEKGELLNF